MRYSTTVEPWEILRRASVVPPLLLRTSRSEVLRRGSSGGGGGGGVSATIARCCFLFHILSLTDILYSSWYEVLLLVCMILYHKDKDYSIVYKN